VPGLYATEFGYFNRDQRRPLDFTVFHTEAQRALWWNDALTRAKNQKLKWFTTYQLTEKTPANQFVPDPTNNPNVSITVANCGASGAVPGWDSGLIGSDGAVTGTRCYGKGSRGLLNRYVHPQTRAAYLGTTG
jgi:hypothetical protein